MSDALELFRELQAEDGIEVTISRGATSITPTVVLGRTNAQALTSRETTFSADTQDVLIEAADYGALVAPEEGDEVSYVEADTGDTVTLEARPASEGEPCFYRWHGGSVFRIHCKVTGRS